MVSIDVLSMVDVHQLETIVIIGLKFTDNVIILTINVQPTILAIISPILNDRLPSLPDILTVFKPHIRISYR